MSNFEAMTKAGTQSRSVIMMKDNLEPDSKYWLNITAELDGRRGNQTYWFRTLPRPSGGQCTSSVNHGSYILTRLAFVDEFVK